MDVANVVNFKYKEVAGIGNLFYIKYSLQT